MTTPPWTGASSVSPTVLEVSTGLHILGVDHEIGREATVVGGQLITLTHEDIAYRLVPSRTHGCWVISRDGDPALYALPVETHGPDGSVRATDVAVAVVTLLDQPDRPLRSLGTEPALINLWPDPPDHPLTYADAQKVSPLKLAGRVGDVLRWLGPAALPTTLAPADPQRLQRRDLELEHLASIRALHDHLAAITANQIHAALISGATAEQVTLATGLALGEVIAIWTTWAAGQRTLEQDLPHLPQHAAAYDFAQRVLERRRGAGW